ncbi:MAG: 2Fe-2S iron-sulfur cluster-binding protein, partial [Candidatus Aerophobetes bacterium]|nr:2Fe-2S iron-sulfur cluster-binding protein [Candidatus Aerophobetes bacterium]
MAEMINLTIDGKLIKTKRGTTILEAALDNGIEIPHLCYQRGLSTAGACRVCLVKIKDRSGMVTSCTTEVEEGMEVIAFDDEINEARKLIIELILSEHPHDCLVCESSGQCELQDLAYQLGIDKIRFPIEEPAKMIEDSSEAILRDPNKCILCGRCIRACAE